MYGQGLRVAPWEGRMAEPILLIHWRAPGDITCMTACVRDLALTYPERYEIHVAGSCSSLWEHNPHVTKVWGATPPRGLPTHRLSYLNSLRESGSRRLHFLTAFYRDLGEKLALHVPVLYPGGGISISATGNVIPGLWKSGIGT